MKSVKEMSFNEKLLRHIIIEFRCDFVGGRENAYLDYSEEEFNEMYPTPLTKEEVVDYIYGEVMCDNKPYIVSPIDGTVMEKKHIRFLGAKFVKELIEDRVQYDYEKNGWNFPNNYYGI